MKRKKIKLFLRKAMAAILVSAMITAQGTTVLAEGTDHLPSDEDCEIEILTENGSEEEISTENESGEEISTENESGEEALTEDAPKAEETDSELSGTEAEDAIELFPGLDSAHLLSSKDLDRKAKVAEYAEEWGNAVAGTEYVQDQLIFLGFQGQHAGRGCRSVFIRRAGRIPVVSFRCQFHSRIRTGL